MSVLEGGMTLQRWRAATGHQTAAEAGPQNAVAALGSLQELARVGDDAARGGGARGAAVAGDGPGRLARIIHERLRELSESNGQWPISNGQWWWAREARRPSSSSNPLPQLVIGNWPLDIPGLFAKVFANNPD